MKQNTQNIAEVRPATSIKSIMEAYPRLSLRCICNETGLCYQYLLKAGKQPIAGAPYDPTATNYVAMDTIIAKKGLDLASFDWAAIEATIAVVEPINKPEDFHLGTEFKLRNDATIYSTVFTTETHIVFMPIDGTQPRVMNWDTFQHQSPRIINQKVEA